MKNSTDYISTPTKNYGELISIALRVKTYFEYLNSEHQVFREMAAEMGKELEELAIQWDINSNKI